MKRIAIILSLLFIYSISFAQQTSPKINKTKIQIGDQIIYSFSLPIEKVDTSYFPIEVKDTLEIVKQTIDTVDKAGKKFLDYKYYLTSFVSGKHNIVTANGKGLEFEVLTYPIDTVKIDIKDIKANAEEAFSIKEIMPIIIWVLIGIAFCFACYFGYKFWKKYRSSNLKDIFIKPKPKLPAHIIALNSLEDLRLKRLIENGRVKEYYSEISEIIREYLCGRFSISAIEMTTDEIFSEVEKVKDISNDSIGLLDYVLKNSDLVKFAKFIPDSYVSDKCMKNSLEFVNQTKPVETLEVNKERKEAENV
jgi:hypothetical protein